MSGFIDPDAHTKDRIGRLEILVAALLAEVPEHRLSSMENLCRLSLQVDAGEAAQLREHRLLKSLGYDTEATP